MLEPYKIHSQNAYRETHTFITLQNTLFLTSKHNLWTNFTSLNSLFAFSSGGYL